jgi:carbon-monoxide dehydrogenase small subunit
MIMATVGLLQRCPQPTDEQIAEGLSGNMCRCTGYVNIAAAVRQAGGQA